MAITKTSFGNADGKNADLYTLSNGNGLVAKVATYGAILTSLEVPDRDGKLADVVLGFDDLAGYLGGSPYFGATVGRVGNRIRNATFELEGRRFALAANNGDHHHIGRTCGGRDNGVVACGELDIMEHIDGSNPPQYAGGAPLGHDWVQSSIHGTGLDGGTPFTETGFSAAEWHTYGMIWSKGQVKFYVDDPSSVYETFTPGQGTWPFDQGPQFVILNLAVGGSWPGNVDGTTVFPGDMQVDYVRIYTN